MANQGQPSPTTSLDPLEPSPASEALPTSTESTQDLPGSPEIFKPGDQSNNAAGNPTPSATVTTHLTSQSPTDPQATAIATSPTTQNAGSSSSSGSSLSTGAVAGIAIAMLFAGAAIAFLVAFFLFKRRNRKRDPNVSAAAYNSYADSTPELVMMQKSTGLGGRSSPYVQVSQTPLPPPAPVPVAALPPVQQTPDSTSFLPAPASERDVYSKVSALFNQIHRHVDTYYRDVHASITSSVEPELARFGGQGVNMVELLQECSNPTTALKHALVAYILGMTGPRKDGEGETLFPDSLNDTRIASANTNNSDTDLAAAVTLHRRLSAYIFSTQNSLSNPRRSWSFQSDIREAAEHFSLTFFPWANPTASDQDKEEDLARLISEALELRVWLFGQPETYDFVWEGTGRRGILISPGLLRRSEDGDESEDRLVVEGSVASI